MKIVSWLAVLIAAWMVCGYAHAQAFVEIQSPQPNAVVGDTVSVRALIMGGVSRVEASIGTHVTTLSAGTGVLSLVGDPEGPKTLTVTAYDASNVATTSKSVSIVLMRPVSPPVDAPPQVIVDAPPLGAVVRPGATIKMEAHCLDDKGACTLDVPAATTIDATQEGTVVTLTASATDSAGQIGTTSVQVYVESSPRLTEVLRAAAGQVIDFDGTRAAVSYASRTEVWSATSGPSIVPSGYSFVSFANDGAVLLSSRVDGIAKNNTALSLWDGSTAVEFARCADFKVAGKWLAMKHQLPPPTSPGQPGPVSPPDAVYAYQLILRDLTAGADVFMSTMTVGFGIREFLVASNGDLFWMLEDLGGTLSLRRNGVLTSLSSGARPVSGLQLDEVHATAQYQDGGQSITYLYSPMGREALCTISVFMGSCPPPTLNGGWLVYTYLVSQSPSPPARRFFRRSPSEGVEELTGLDVDWKPEAVSPTGEIMIPVQNRRMLLAHLGAAPMDVSSTLGRAIYRDGWYVVLGRSVFSVGAPAAGGPEDAGLPLDGGAQPAGLDAGADLPDGALAVDDAGSPDAAVPTTPIAADSAIAAGAIDGAASDAAVDVPHAASTVDEEGCSLADNDGPPVWTSLLVLGAILGGKRRRWHREREL